MNLEEAYYFLNAVWYYGNIIMMVPFGIALVNRFRHPSIETQLWTDYLGRMSLAFTVVFYFFDMLVKYQIDGGDSICQKAFFIHHIASLFLITPLFLNKHLPWWVNPVGFFHGICIYFPQYQIINYFYAGMLFIFQFGIHQRPYRDMKGYNITRYFINYIWVFALTLLLGDCSNYLPLGPT